MLLSIDAIFAINGVEYKNGLFIVFRAKIIYSIIDKRKAPERHCSFGGIFCSCVTSLENVTYAKGVGDEFAVQILVQIAEVLLELIA